MYRQDKTKAAQASINKKSSKCGGAGLFARRLLCFLVLIKCGLTWWKEVKASCRGAGGKGKNNIWVGYGGAGFGKSRRDILSGIKNLGTGAGSVGGGQEGGSGWLRRLVPSSQSQRYPVLPGPCLLSFGLWELFSQLCLLLSVNCGNKNICSN